MKIVIKIIAGILILIVLSIVSVFIYYSFIGSNSEPNWHIEKNAIPTKSHPLSGFYKDEGCGDKFGWAIGPVNEKEYYISFCGPGGCFAEGTYRPNTTIYNDPVYQVINEDTIKFLSGEEWSKHVRCKSRT